MRYKVTKQYSKGPELPIAEFNDMTDAKSFIETKLDYDARVKVKVIYRLFEGMDLVDEFSEAVGGGSSGGSAAGAGAQQRTSFQPTPFNASPRPPGLPPNWLKDENPDDENKG